MLTEVVDVSDDATNQTERTDAGDEPDCAEQEAECAGPEASEH